jgi:hypothetical protein
MPTEGRASEEDAFDVIRPGDGRPQNLFKHQVGAVIRVQLRSEIR